MIKNLWLLGLFLLLVATPVDAIFSSQVSSTARTYAFENESFEVSPAVPVRISDDVSCWVATIVTPDGGISGFIPIDNVDGSIIVNDVDAKACFKAMYVIREVNKLKSQDSWFLSTGMGSNMDSLGETLSNKKLDLSVYVAPSISDSVTLATLTKTQGKLNDFVDLLSDSQEKMFNSKRVQDDLLGEPSQTKLLQFRSGASGIFRNITDLQNASDDYLQTTNFELIPALNIFMTDHPEALDPAFAKRANPPYTSSSLRSDIILPLQNSRDVLNKLYEDAEDETFLNNLMTSLLTRVDRVTVVDFRNSVSADISGVLQNPSIWNDQSGVSDLQSKWSSFEGAIDGQRFDEAVELISDLNSLVMRVKKDGYARAEEPEDEGLDLSGYLPQIIVGIIILGAVMYFMQNKDKFSPETEMQSAPSWDNRRRPEM
ncbi:MAG: hypothetical protein GOV15_00935 [Candidatus Diapherotrites archaeon]|nr:hypothetical protein [Candidatus Diapherotrites archaeon]